MTKANGAALTRDAILAAEDRALERVEVPEWGGHVFVRGMSGADRDRFDATVHARSEAAGKDLAKANDNMRALLVSLCAVDADGERLFGEGDVEALGGKSAAALNRVYRAAARASGLERAGLEEAEGNFDAARSGGSR